MYPYLNRDLLVTSALCHDIGKTKELSAFPVNDYTDDGQLLGHIMIGAEMLHDAIRTIEGFPVKLETELKHCILAHHGELEYGSPKETGPRGSGSSEPGGQHGRQTGNTERSI